MNCMCLRYKEAILWCLFIVGDTVDFIKTSLFLIYLDMIEFKIKEVFWIRKIAELSGPLPVLCPRPIGSSQHLCPLFAPCFSKTTISRCHLDMSLHVSKQQNYNFYSFILALIFCPEFCFLAFLNHKEKAPATFNQIKLFSCLPSGYTT